MQNYCLWKENGGVVEDAIDRQCNRETRNMGRPEIHRRVTAPPPFSRFKPAGVRAMRLEEVNLTLDEYEALRLADYDGMDHAAAAKTMSISRPTFSRLIARARKKVAELIVDGRALVIDGGQVHFSENLIRCIECGTRFTSPIARSGHVCPECGSGRVEDIAAKFGHGRCCGRNGKRKI